jgi:hypothetical protein
MSERITFELRNEEGLHCRFCNFTIEDNINLYETSPIKGIVCQSCMKHLKSYLPSPSAGGVKENE